MVTKYPKLQDVEWLKSKVVDKRLREIAEEVGCSYHTVQHAIKKYGIEIPNRKRYHIKVDKSDAVKAGLRRKYPNGRFGDQSSNWRGGRISVNGGYIYIYSPDHPRATKHGYIFEHILVAEQKIGRFLEKGEIVHHINGDRTDNSPDNLLVCTRKEHVQIHMDAVKEVFRLRKILDINGISY